MYDDVNVDYEINMTSDRSWMTADDASRALQVTRSTLYAYVSRGFVRSESRPGATRERRYSRDDVERLRRRTEGRRDPDKAAAQTLQWGLPILESSITLIAGNTLFYRGHDAVELARARSLAEVASLIWTGQFGTTFPPLAAGANTRNRSDADLPFVARAQAALAIASAHDPRAFDLRPRAVAATGWRIFGLLAGVAARSRARAATIEERLAQAWGTSARSHDVLRAALILCADHELNVSSFTARCVASSGSNPYAVVTAGLAAIQGIRHGGLSLRVESLLGSLRRARSVRAELADRLRRGEPIDGFGHPLYRDGDPRAIALMALLRDAYGRSPELTFANEVATRAADLGREQPTIDFALAALARVLRLPAGSPLTLFALGRTIGWIGHAIEQYATEKIIRPRAKYVGIPPPAGRPTP
jgi:citrate synthase